MTQEAMASALRLLGFKEIDKELGKNKIRLALRRERCAFAIALEIGGNPVFRDFGTMFAPFPSDQVLDVIHLPGLRGNPERSYQVARVSGRYPGPFPAYAASTILAWSETQANELHAVGEDLRLLGLTWKVAPKQLDDARVELRVGRVPSPQQGGANDLVSIADVGFGTSQVLPVVVALRAAKRGQFVHIEQPELHLHPNAQVHMASLLVDAAARGVRLFVETHSSILLKAVQIAVAEDRIPFKDVVLHWFSRDDDGVTRVSSVEPDSTGSYGEWPVDFADIELAIERKFVDVAYPVPSPMKGRGPIS